MSEVTGLGVLLRFLRENRQFSLRELGTLAEVDHAYIHRLEAGGKSDPSEDVLGRLLRSLKANPNQVALAQWLRDMPAADPSIIEVAVSDASYPLDVIKMAAVAAYRGTGRASAKERLERARRLWDED